MKKIAKITEIKPRISKCIEVDSNRKLFRSGNTIQQTTQNTTQTYNPLTGNTENNVNTLKNKGFVTHNSVLQRSIIFSCVLRPESWYFAGIDLKKVELSPYVVYSNVVLGVAMTLEHALEVLRFAQQVMMKRYQTLTQLGLKNFLDMPGQNRALMVMVDEYGEAASPTGSKTEEGKEADNMKGEIQMIVGSIARLGRAAGVHLVIATQRPDAKLLGGEVKSNLGVRINCGYTPAIASNMILDNMEGTKVKPKPKGRFYIRIYSSGNHGQAFFAKEDWMDNYLESKGLNQNGTPKGTNTTQQNTQNTQNENLKLELTTQEEEGGKYDRPEDDWDDDIESLISENNE